MKNEHQSVYNTLHQIYQKHRRNHPENGDSGQMCCMWSTDDPPDIIEGTPPFDDIEAAFAISVDDDTALELYNMEVAEAAKRIDELQRLQATPDAASPKSGVTEEAPTTPHLAVLELAACFLRNGYVRRHNPVRYAAVGCMKYKKGDEVRLVANDDVEREHILLLLQTAGFKPGRPFRKRKQGGQYRVPLYGREQVAHFLRIVEETGLPIGIGSPIAEAPSHTTGRTDRVSGDSAVIDRPLSLHPEPKSARQPEPGENKDVAHDLPCQPSDA